MNKKKKRGFFEKWFIPDYTVVFLFLASVLFILGFAFEERFRDLIIMMFESELIEVVYLSIMSLAFAMGLFFSIYYTFANSPPKIFIKYLMLYFIIFFEFFIGILSGGYIITNSIGILLIFPALNILNAISLYVLFRGGKINESNISETKAKNHEIIIGLISVTLLFFINRYFGVFWAVNLSVCLGYAYKMNEFVTGLVWKTD